MLDKFSPDFWRSIKPQSTITLSDQQTLELAMKEGRGLESRDYVVHSVFTFRDNDRFGEWKLFELVDEEQDLYLLVKIVDDQLDVRVYFAPEEDEFDPGNRADMIDDEHYWMFMEPEDPDSFKLEELEFTEEFGWLFDDGKGGETEVVYQMKKQGVLFGEGEDLPVKSGDKPLFTALVEYRSVEDAENPEALILETGGEESDEGGYITLLFGCPVKTEEIDVLKA